MSSACVSMGGLGPDEAEDSVRRALPWVDVSNLNVTTAAGVEMPRLIYGTAWKETRIGPGATADLVEQAIMAGFRGVDTACQPMHYHEPGVGEGLARIFAKVRIELAACLLGCALPLIGLLAQGQTSRESLFIQVCGCDAPVLM